VLYAYLMWIMVTRLVQALSLWSVRDSIDGRWPMLIYYNQVYGALLKGYILFRLDRQRWTRQNIAPRSMLNLRQIRMRALGSAYLHGLALAALATGLAFTSGVLTLPSFATLARLF
jgi:glycosyltransferase Alg8